MQRDDREEWAWLIRQRQPARTGYGIALQRILGNALREETAPQEIPQKPKKAIQALKGKDLCPF